MKTQLIALPLAVLITLCSLTLLTALAAPLVPSKAVLPLPSPSRTAPLTVVNLPMITVTPSAHDRQLAAQTAL
jgi:hypothetical protein